MPVPRYPHAAMLFTLLVGVLMQQVRFAVGASESTLVVEAHKTNVTEILQGVPDGDRVLFEFYANWCPHCKHFKPTYEEVGTYFMSEPRVKPSVFVVRLDCALKENQGVCNDYGVMGYPTVRFGEAQQFLDKDLEKLENVKDRKTELIVKAIGTLLKVEYKLEVKGEAEPVEKAPIVQLPVERKETHQVAHMDDIEKATVEIFDHIFSNNALMQNLQQRNGLLKFLELLSVAHPSERCKHSATYLVNTLEDHWPKDGKADVEKLRKFRICTKNIEELDWVKCNGSVPDSRGFTCGVWSLLHSLAARVPKKMGGTNWHEGVSGFVGYFFGCKVCADHFYQLLQTPDARSMNTRKDAVMWLWSVHNQVNARLAKEEAHDGTGDPDFPKIQWPSKEQCPSCKSTDPDADSEEWDMKEVHAFLTNFYESPEEPPVKRERWTGGSNPDLKDPSQQVKTPNLGRKDLTSNKVSLGSEIPFPKFSEGEQKAGKETGIGLGPIVCLVIIAIVMIALRGNLSKTRKATTSKEV